MSFWEDMMQAVRKMGDPDELANGEDLIILKLENPLPSSRSVPQPLTADASRSVFTTGRDGVMSCRSFLVRQSYSTVLFSGLPELKSMKGFVNALRDIVSKTQELIIVHNRDRMVDLMSWFTKVSRLILYHDLMLQTECTSNMREMAQLSHLRQVWGTTPAVGTEELFLCPLTLTMLLANCPALSEIQAPVDEMVLLAERFAVHSPHLPPMFHDVRELTLGCYLRRSSRNATMMRDTRLSCMKKALERYPNLEQLQVTTTSRKVLACIPEFSRLKRLSVMYGAAHKGMCPFDNSITNVLHALPLTHLTLKYFGGVVLSTIDSSCQNLECLSLLGCDILDEKIQAGSFSKLKSLALSDSIMEEAFFTLLNAAEGLTDLHLDGEWIISAYVGGPPSPVYQRPMHFALEQLTLATDWTVPALCVTIEELRRLIESMPLLRHLTTDSYDIRLCVQHYYPRVTLAWTTCTTCTAEFPKMNTMQHEIWQAVHGDDVDDEKT
ncbi:hypothetical protein HPB50_027179 [Hyalomma asiaticum]|uniref:Uncharacterized protein n=1 Tax=Hyalomma asiaticum TaxID=266040 RepID=A0ACB7RVW4_HYAAI|nr:hypothetical protein HPB50_027179 [Hyalomma asiaticum]